MVDHDQIIYRTTFLKLIILLVSYNQVIYLVDFYQQHNSLQTDLIQSYNCPNASNYLYLLFCIFSNDIMIIFENIIGVFKFVWNILRSSPGYLKCSFLPVHTWLALYKKYLLGCSRYTYILFSKFQLGRSLGSAVFGKSCSLIRENTLRTLTLANMRLKVLSFKFSVVSL